MKFVNKKKNYIENVKQSYPSLRMKTVVIGDKSCGKTCLYNRYAKETFPSYIPSVFEHYVHDTEVDGRQVEIALWDTLAGE